MFTNVVSRTMAATASTSRASPARSGRRRTPDDQERRPQATGERRQPAAGDSHISGLTTSNNQLYGLRLNGITSSVQVDSYSNVAGDILFDTSSIRNIVTLVHDTGMARVTNNGENNVILDMSTGTWHVPIWIFWPPINAKPFDPMRVTTAQRDALGDLKDGALVFNTQSGVLNLRRLAVWVAWPQAFEARLPLSRFYVTGIGTTDGGTTLDSREPSDGIGGGNNTPAVWWTWTAPCTFTSTVRWAFIDTSTSDIGTIVGVFTGSSINALSLFASAQNPHGPVAGQSPVPISAGTTFQIRVRSAGSQNGVVRLRINGDASACPSLMRGRSQSPTQALHVTELRGRIDELRAGAGLAAFAWTDPSSPGAALSKPSISTRCGRRCRRPTPPRRDRDRFRSRQPRRRSDHNCSS